MAAQLSGIWLNNSGVALTGEFIRRREIRSSLSALPAAHPSTNSPIIQIVGGKKLGWNGMDSSKLSSTLGTDTEEFDWAELEADLHHWTRQLRPVQWYPGHIAKTEKELKDQLKLMDVVIEVRDARIPMSTSHPLGTLKLCRLAKELAGDVNIKRKTRGLLPRAIRAGIVGYPNVGKSSLINRLLKRRICPAAPRPGVTRELKWVRFGKDLELLDSPGMIPMRINDQAAAFKLAICDDIGERSYDFSEVAAILVQILSRLPSVGNEALQRRYKMDTDGRAGRIFVQKLALRLFNGDTHQAAFRILSDYRKGKFGWVSLEMPPKLVV